MSERSQIRVAILGTVGGGIILAALGWLFAPEKLALAWEFLRRRVPVPIWGLGVGVAVVAFMGLVIRETILEAADRIAAANEEAERQQRIALTTQQALDRASEGTETKEPQRPDDESPPFASDELPVVRVFVKADGEWLSIPEIANTMNSKHLLVQHVVDRLLGRRLLEDYVSHRSGWCFRLSSSGRAAAVRAGLV